MAYRIDNATASVSLPTPAAVGPNVNGYFTKGNPSLGTPATIVDDDWANAIQEEICGVIEAAGITLSKTNRAQLLQAIEIISQKDIALYTTSTTAANTYTATLSPVPAAYTEGMVAFVKFTNANTGAATINFNSLGAKSIKHLDSSALSASDIAAGAVALLIYDGTNFQMIGLNPANFVTNAQHQNDSPSYVSSTTAANTYTASLSPAATAYTTGMRVSIKFTNANTGAATINLNSLGAKSITLPDGTALVAGNIAAGQVCDLRYDGTNFQIQSPGNGVITAGNGLSKSASVITAARTLVTYTTTTTLTTAANSCFVQLGTVAISTGFTVTLPSVSAFQNKYLDFYVNMSGNALVNIVTSDGSNINLRSGATGITFGNGEAGTLWSDGSNWILLNLITQPIYGSVYCNNAQTITTGTLTKINYDTVISDNYGFFDISTNHRLTPKYPGTYLVEADVMFAASATITNIQQDILLYKNGAAVKGGGRSVNAATFTTSSVSTKAIISCNGSSDYIEAFCEQQSGGNLNTSVSDGYVKFLFTRLNIY